MDKPQQGWVNAIAQAAAIRQAIRKNVPKGAVAMRTLRLAAWFKTGLFWVTQTIGILLPGEGGLDAEMKKTGRVSNPFRVQLKGAETA